MKNLRIKDQKLSQNVFKKEKKKLVLKYLALNFQNAKALQDENSFLMTRLSGMDSLQGFKTKAKFRCNLTGTSHGVYHRYRVSRHIFQHNNKELKKIYNLQKASW